MNLRMLIYQNYFIIPLLRDCRLVSLARRKQKEKICNNTSPIFLYRKHWNITKTTSQQKIISPLFLMGKHENFPKLRHNKRTRQD